MVSYKLSVLNKKEVKVIELEKIIKIKELRMLDEFTSNFTNENELKMYLLKKGLITKEELNKDIKVTYKNNNQIKKLPVLYKNLQKYKDIVLLRNKLVALSKNPEFLKKLADHYSNGSTKYNKQMQNIADIRTYLSGFVGENDNMFEYELLSNAVNDLFEKAIIKSINNAGEILIDYRGKRNLMFFIDNYEKSKEVKTEFSRKKWIQDTLYGMEQDNLSFNNENRETEFNYENNLSSAGDPDFPFNSEEEEMYKMYIESFPDEYHPHKR